jgi:hypothetical protein
VALGVGQPRREDRRHRRRGAHAPRDLRLHERVPERPRRARPRARGHAERRPTRRPASPRAKEASISRRACAARSRREQLGRRRPLRDRRSRGIHARPIPCSRSCAPRSARSARTRPRATRCPIKLDANESPFALPAAVMRGARRAQVRALPLQRYPDLEVRALKHALAGAGSAPSPVAARRSASAPTSPSACCSPRSRGRARRRRP